MVGVGSVFESNVMCVRFVDCVVLLWWFLGVGVERWWSDLCEVGDWCWWCKFVGVVDGGNWCLCMVVCVVVYVD